MKIDKEKINNISKKVSDKTKNVVSKSKDVVVKSKEKVVEKIDANGDGNIDIQDIIILGLRVPGIKIDRENFLKKEFENKYTKEIVQKAIDKNPMIAGIELKDINKIADEVIKFERNCVTGISAALSAPGAGAMAVTIPADIIQYYGYMLRTAQKLMYLYGFPQIDIKEKGQMFDTATLNILTICIGVMYGVAGANKAINVMAKAFANGVERKLVNAALTKGKIYPIVKSVATWFGQSINKKVFAKFFKNIIPPLATGLIGGGMTFFAFKPCCNRLKESLKDTMLSNPNYVEKDDEDILIDAEEFEVVKE